MLIVMYLVFPGNLDVQDSGMGVCGVLYGAALIAAAIQVRASEVAGAARAARFDLP